MANTAETFQLSVRVPAKLHRKIQAYSQRYGVNQTSAVILLINQGLENSGQTALDPEPEPEDTP
jgi:hypothetical protein